MEQKPKDEDREFSGRGMASIFGAPISWVALFGALMGALSIVPMIFYPFGGGFASAGMVVFWPHGRSGPGSLGRGRGRFGGRSDRHVHIARILSFGSD